jgi:hypothetical protein
MYLNTENEAFVRQSNRQDNFTNQLRRRINSPWFSAGFLIFLLPKSAATCWY